jgi:hypothetical protein
MLFTPAFIAWSSVDPRSSMTLCGRMWGLGARAWSFGALISTDYELHAYYWIPTLPALDNVYIEFSSYVEW